VKFAFILTRQVAFPIATMCRLLDVSTSGFYSWRSQPVSAREGRDAVLLKKVATVFNAFGGKYGSPRVVEELRAEGHVVSERKVAVVMRDAALVARPKKRYRATTDSKHGDPIASNLLARNFRADDKNLVWVTDVTAIWTQSGWLFLAAMLDLYSRRVVGWATSATNDRFLALDALRDAIQKRKPLPGLTAHSDRGSPYASDDYRAELDRFGIVPSMSRKGDCWDNAVAESFFSTLKTELVGNDIYASHAAATRVLGDYIDGFYNAKRRHSYLGYISPIEFELRRQTQAMAA
jgi:transposase InsO family protein